MRKSIQTWVGVLAIGLGASCSGQVALAGDVGHIGGGAGYGSDGFFGDAVGGLEGNGYVTDNHMPSGDGLIDDSWLHPGHAIARDYSLKHKRHTDQPVNQ